jgi:hypothetical protein
LPHRNPDHRIGGRLEKAKADSREVRGPVDHRFVRSNYFRDPNSYVIELTASTGSARRDHGSGDLKAAPRGGALAGGEGPLTAPLRIGVIARSDQSKPTRSDDPMWRSYGGRSHRNPRSISGLVDAKGDRRFADSPVEQSGFEPLVPLTLNPTNAGERDEVMAETGLSTFGKIASLGKNRSGVNQRRTRTLHDFGLSV